LAGTPALHFLPLPTTWQVPDEKFLDAHANFFHANIPQTMRCREPAVIGAQLAGTCLSINPCRRRMQWYEPLRQLRSKNYKCRHAANGCQMSRLGIIADECPRSINKRKQFGDGA